MRNIEFSKFRQKGNVQFSEFLHYILHCPVLLQVKVRLVVLYDVFQNCCSKLRVLTQWTRIPSSSMVAHDSAQFLQPSCVLLPKTETSVPQFAPANVLHHFSNKGRLLDTLTELYLFVILPDFLLHSSMFKCLSLKIFSVYLVIIFSSNSLHSFTRDREDISSQNDSLTCTLRLVSGNKLCLTIKACTSQV